MEGICKSLGVPSVASCRLDVKEFRKIVTKACHTENEKRLRKQSEGIGKCQRIQSEAYGKKLYIAKEKLHVARKNFKTRFGMSNFAGNYKNNIKYKKNNWMCFCKNETENEAHLTSGKCQVYGDLKEKYRLDDDKNLMLFFEEVMQRREELEDEEVTAAGLASTPGDEAEDTMTLLATTVASQLGGRDAQLAVSL